jgi:nucleoside-diphosphate-sugar epimerase
VRADYQVQLDNVAYTCQAFLNAAEMGISRFVYAASLMEYDVMKQFHTDSTKLKCNQFYGMGKLSAHFLLLSLANDSKTKLCAALISNVYGPGENTSRLVNSTIRILLKENSASFTLGHQLCDFIYIDDVVRGLKLIGEKGWRDYYYLGSCRIMPLRQYLEMFKLINPTAELRMGDIPFDGVSLSYSEFDIHRLYLDIGFQTEISFEEGIRRTADWIKENQLHGGEKE